MPECDPNFDPPWTDHGNGLMTRPMRNNLLVCSACGSHWTTKRGIIIVCAECGSSKLNRTEDWHASSKEPKIG